MSELGPQEPALRMEGLAWQEGSDMLGLRSVLGPHRLGLWPQAEVHMSGLLWLAGLQMLVLRSQAAGVRMLGLQLQAAGLHMLALQLQAAGLHMLGLQWLAGLHKALAAQALGSALLPACMRHNRNVLRCLLDVTKQHSS